MVNIYWAGGEDSDYVNIGQNAVSTTTFFFRSAYARCALVVVGNSNIKFWSAVPGVGGSSGWNASPSTFWIGARINQTVQNGFPADMLRITDSSGVVRLRIVGTASGVFTIFKQSAALVATQLGSPTVSGLTPGATTPDKVDFFINYAVAGSMSMYINGVQIFTFSGDVTTDGQTILNGHQLGAACTNNGDNTAWSEFIVADSDTRSWSLQTLAPVANGNTHNFNTGSPAAANVNEITLSDTTFDGSSVAGEIDQYTVPAIAAGSYSILAIGVSARAQEGFSGPSKLDTGVRSSATDTWSSDHSLVTAFANYQDWWNADPATSAAWAALPTNIGLRSVT